MMDFVVAFVTVNLPGKIWKYHGPSPDWFGLIEVTSKDGEGAPVDCGDCARTCGAFKRPNTKGPPMAATPTPANNSFLLKLSLVATGCVMIRVILLLRFPPVTPD